MKVAIDIGPLISGHKVRGVGTHTGELIKGIKKLKQRKVGFHEVDFEKANLSKYDVVHYQYFHPYFSVLPPKKPAKRVVVTIHDLIPLLYKENYPPGFAGRINFLKQKARLRYVDSIITISETSKKDICRLLGINPQKVHVVRLAPKEVFYKKNIKNEKEIKQKYDLPDRFVLYVGDVNYNKNIITLLKACSLAKVSLVICGKQAKEVENLGKGLDVLGGPQDWIRFVFNIPHPEHAHFNKLNEALKKNGKVIRTGFVTDKDLVSIFNLATLYCQPSLYEGFGLPILEAMACGTPVVASKIQAHVEMAEGAALFVNPNRASEFASRFKRIIRSKETREELIKKGVKKAKEYSWEKTAKQTLKVYERLKE